MNKPTLTDILQGRESTQGAATVEILGALGAAFTLCQPVTEHTKGKEAIGHAWRDNPRTTEAALAHIRANRGRNNIGILTRAGGLVSFDCDRMAAEFLTGAGLEDGFIVHRRNSDDRCKVLLVCADPDNLPDRVTTIASADDRGNFLEASGRRSNVIVAGTHHSGAAVEMAEGRVIVRSAAEIGQIVDDYRAWLGEHGHQVKADTSQLPPSVSSKPMPTMTVIKSAGRLVDWQQLTHEAIEWMIEQGAYKMDAGRALANCTRRGAYVAIRPDDGTPSTRRTDTRDGFHKATYRDFGSNKTFDEFELAVMNSGRDRRELVNEAIDEFLQATWGRTLESLRAELAIAATRKRERVERDTALMAGR